MNKKLSREPKIVIRNKVFKSTLILLIALFLFMIAISTAFACTNYSQEKDFYYGTYSHTPSVSYTFNLCGGGSYFNTAKSWWYDYSTPSNSGWMLRYFEGRSSNYSQYNIIGYSVSFWTPGAWGQITDFNVSVPPYKTLDTNELSLIATYPYPHYGTGSRGEYYNINFTTLTSDSTNYTIYQEVYPYSI